MVAETPWFVVPMENFMHDYLPTEEKFPPADHNVSLLLNEPDARVSTLREEPKSYQSLVRSCLLFLCSF